MTLSIYLLPCIIQCFQVVGRKYIGRHHSKDKFDESTFEIHRSNPLKAGFHQKNRRMHNSEIELYMKLKLIITP